MSTLFMFILFFLNILTIFTVIVLYLRQNRLKQIEKDQKAIVLEMEDLMNGYIMEIKEENEALLDRLLKKEQEKAPQIGTLKPEPAVFVENTNNHEEHSQPATNSTIAKAAAVYKYQTSKEETPEAKLVMANQDHLELSTKAVEAWEEESDKPKDTSTFSKELKASLNGQATKEPSPDEQALSLFKQGLSADEIAQTLKRGKTEIELLLKFQSCN